MLATTYLTRNALERVQRVHEPADLCDIPFAPADLEAFSTMCTRCFETQSSPGCTCTRRSKFLRHSLFELGLIWTHKTFQNQKLPILTFWTIFANRITVECKCRAGRRVRQKEREASVGSTTTTKSRDLDRATTISRSTARGSRNSSAPACNLLKRGRNVAKLFRDWFKIQNGFQNYFKNGWNELFFLNQVLKQFFFENIDKKWILGWSQKARIEEELILITFH
jgi:hypothetical protein